MFALLAAQLMKASSQPYARNAVEETGEKTFHAAPPAIAASEKAATHPESIRSCCVVHFKNYWYGNVQASRAEEGHRSCQSTGCLSVYPAWARQKVLDRGTNTSYFSKRFI